ncbi:hypothetical protein C900_03989 [Fulvivirga imtechensis AK7]|uniref:Uncharacterized protein n=1 Tax=Fulvivirga imtechensis AK7 TaxID=1237149 RepID=L8JS54_9BACT|nr:hypothetical protein C900_03989 [Fulvivirga imtechensis AK7]
MNNRGDYYTELTWVMKKNIVVGGVVSWFLIVHDQGKVMDRLSII